MPLQLNLSDDQVKALSLAIDSYYSELREEIYHTDDYNERQTLKGVEQALSQIRMVLEPGWQAAPGYPADAGQGMTAVASTSISAEPPPGKGTPPIGAPDTGASGVG